MKKLSKKGMSIWACGLLLIAGCGSATEAQTAAQPTQDAVVEAEPASIVPVVTSTMTEILPSGENIPVDAVVIEGPALELLIQKQSELQKSIAQETDLNPEEVVILLAPLSKTAEDGVFELSCSMVLRTDSEFDNATIERILDDIVNTVGEESEIMKIGKANIIITNEKGTQLT